MKSVLAIIILLLSVSYAKEQEPVSKGEVFDFIKGFMNGAGLKDLYSCVEELIRDKVYEEWYYEITDVLGKIKELNIHEWKQLKAIVLELADVFKSIYLEATSCFTGSEEIAEIIKEFLAIKPKELLKKILKEIIENKGKLFDDIMNIIKAAKNKDFYTVGFEIADFFENILFRMVELNQPNPLEFIHGFMVGAGLGDLYTCVEEMIKDKMYEKWYYEIADVIIKIKNIKIKEMKDIVEIFDELVYIGKSIYEEATSCFAGSEELIALFKEIMSINIKNVFSRIIKEIIENKGKLFDDIMGIIKAAKNGDCYKVGFQIADFFNNLLFKMTEMLSPKDDVLNFVKGYMYGIGLKDLYSCVEEMLKEKIYEKWYFEVLDVIKKIKQLNIQDFESIKDLIVEIGQVLASVFDEAKSCFAGSKDIVALIEKIKAIDFKQLIPRIVKELIANKGKLFDDVMNLIKAAKNGDFYKLGFDMADMLANLLWN